MKLAFPQLTASLSNTLSESYNQDTLRVQILFCSFLESQRFSGAYWEKNMPQHWLLLDTFTVLNTHSFTVCMDFNFLQSTENSVFSKNKHCPLCLSLQTDFARCCRLWKVAAQLHFSQVRTGCVAMSQIHHRDSGWLGRVTGPSRLFWFSGSWDSHCKVKVTHGGWEVHSSPIWAKQ